MNLVTKQEAIKQSLSKYFTGIACKNGHIAERYVRSGACVMCIKEGVKKHMAKNTANPTYEKSLSEALKRIETLEQIVTKLLNLSKELKQEEQPSVNSKFGIHNYLYHGKRIVYLHQRMGREFRELMETVGYPQAFVVKHTGRVGVTANKLFTEKLSEHFGKDLLVFDKPNDIEWVGIPEDFLNSYYRSLVQKASQIELEKAFA